MLFQVVIVVMIFCRAAVQHERESRYKRHAQQNFDPNEDTKLNEDLIAFDVRRFEMQRTR